MCKGWLILGVNFWCGWVGCGRRIVLLFFVCVFFRSVVEESWFVQYKSLLSSREYYDGIMICFPVLNEHSVSCSDTAPRESRTGYEGTKVLPVKLYNDP